MPRGARFARPTALSSARDPQTIIFGAGGQLGLELQAIAPSEASVTALNHQELDITDARQVRDRVHALRPSLIINAAAYTAVDAAESDRERAFAVNADGAANIAEAAKSVEARLVHISTDYVFDGRRRTPYPPQAEPNPLNVYGASKLAGERRVADVLEGQAMIIRASWLYSRYGRNFVKTMLRLFTERDQVSVVADQTGVPTWGKSLAAVVWAAGAAGHLHGVYHWADGGTASWYEFALAIYAEARALQLVDRTVEIRPIRSDEYRAAARRAPYSVLDAARTIDELGMRPEPWGTALRQMLCDMTP
jgi:dTDP-4-dehydrorhamnose reductase